MNPTESAMNEFRYRHGVKSRNEVETTDSRGYWRFKRVCNGECCMGHKHTMQHTIHFSEPCARDKRGRFVDPYRAWREWKKTEVARAADDEIF